MNLFPERCKYRGTECRCALSEGHDIQHRCAHMRDPNHKFSVEAMYDPEIYLRELEAMEKP